MTKILLKIVSITILCCYSASYAQVGIGTATPNPSAILDLYSSDQGLLLPRVNLRQTTLSVPLAAHVNGMIVYNTATINDVKPGVYINDGTSWQSVTEAITRAESLTADIANLQNAIPIKRAILLAGQSNTLSGSVSGPTLLPDFSGKGLSQLGRGDVNLQVVPLTFYGTYSNSYMDSGSSSKGSFGSIFLSHYYDKLKVEYPGRKIELLLIHCGKGAAGWGQTSNTALSWRTDQALYADLISRIKWAKSNGYQLDAALWHQGETEADNSTINFKDILKNHIQNIRDFAGDQKLPFILGEMSKDWVRNNTARVAVQDILNSIPLEVPYTQTVTSENLSVSDGIHFDARSHVILGQRYFDAYLLSLSNTFPTNYSAAVPGENLMLHHNSSANNYFPGIFEAIRYGSVPTNNLYSVLGDIWKYKNSDGYYHFKLQILNTTTGIVNGVFEWKQKFSPFGTREDSNEDNSGFIILANTIGINLSSGQGFSGLTWDTPVNYQTYTTLFRGDIRTNLWWFAIGQTSSFNNRLAILQTNDTINRIKLFCIKD